MIPAPASNFKEVSRAPYGARGLKLHSTYTTGSKPAGRAPYGARGLKSILRMILPRTSMSRPVWGAWIEIFSTLKVPISIPGRAPYGARGLKYRTSYSSAVSTRRAPYGARGLKSVLKPGVNPIDRSRPVWGAWIEIFAQLRKRYPNFGRAPYGARGLKYGVKDEVEPVLASRPVWGAWIEMPLLP